MDLSKIDPNNLDHLEFAQLDAIREDIVRRANGDLEAIPDDELSLLVHVMQTIRRKSSGPAAAPKTPRASKKTGKSLADLDLDGVL